MLHVESPMMSPLDILVGFVDIRPGSTENYTRVFSFIANSVDGTGMTETTLILGLHAAGLRRHIRDGHQPTAAQHAFGHRLRAENQYAWFMEVGHRTQLQYTMLLCVFLEMR